MTGNFITQAQVEAELKKVNAPKNWRVILVVGASTAASSKSKLKAGSGPKPTSASESQPNSGNKRSKPKS